LHHYRIGTQVLSGDFMARGREFDPVTCRGPSIRDFDV
jgi:hypothetical protein